MTGFMILLALVAAVGGGLWWLGHLRGAALQLGLAALMVGSAGYALQGRPGLPGVPREGQGRRPPLPLTEPRQAMLGRFNQSDRWITIAEGFASRGETADAVGVIRAGIRAHPRDAALWTGLGNALVDHAGMMSPAATLAYQRAQRLAPRHPAPLFFHGLALARTGERDQALRLWREALAKTPEGASYRPIIAGGIAALSTPAQSGTQARGAR